MTAFGLIETAFAILFAAATIGAGLAIRHMRANAKPPPRAIPAIHGVVGAAGLAALAVALDRGLPPSAMGTAGFGSLAGVLFGLALALGLALAAVSRRRRRAGALVAVHGSLAIAGLVVLWVLVSLE